MIECSLVSQPGKAGTGPRPVAGPAFRVDVGGLFYRVLVENRSEIQGVCYQVHLCNHTGPLTLCLASLQCYDSLSFSQIWHVRISSLVKCFCSQLWIVDLTRSCELVSTSMTLTFLTILTLEKKKRFS